MHLQMLHWRPCLGGVEAVRARVWFVWVFIVAWARNRSARSVGEVAEEDELGLPTTAGMLAPALTAEQQEGGRRWAAQDAHYDYEDEMFDDHGGDYGRGDDY